MVSPGLFSLQKGTAFNLPKTRCERNIFLGKNENCTVSPRKPLTNPAKMCTIKANQILADIVSDRWPESFYRDADEVTTIGWKNKMRTDFSVCIVFFSGGEITASRLRSVLFISERGLRNEAHGRKDPD